MYESPIEIHQTSTQYTAIFDKEKDSMILKAVQGVGVDVDKEELLKALKYDRQQYQKGYADGIEELIDRLKMNCVIVGDEERYVYLSDIVRIAEEMGFNNESTL